MANEVIIKVTGDTRRAEQDFQSLARKITGISNTVTNLIAGGMMAAIGKAIIGAASDSQRVLAQLDQVLKSTGMTAGVTREAVIALAEAQSKLTGIDDEAIISAENMLLTFTNIHANVFPATTRAVMDMATAMNGGALPSMEQLRATAIQVGKALQDPVEGVTALQRVGVRLTEGQKALIEKMMETNDVAGAQALILQELQTEFGGSAEAAGNTFPGALGRARTALGNVAEEIGGAVLPMLTDLMNAFAEHVPNAIRTAQISIEQLRAIFLFSLSKMAEGLANLLDGILNVSIALSDSPIFGKEWGALADNAIRAQHELRRAALILREGTISQIDVANQAAAPRAQRSVEDLFKSGPRPGAYSVGGPSGDKARAARGLKEREPSILDLPELMRRSFPEDFFTKIVRGFDVITPEVQATLDDWRRQYNEFGRDSAILLQEINTNGTAQSQSAIQQFWAIVDAWAQLPEELQGPLDEIQKQFQAILDREATFAQERATEVQKIWQSATDKYLFNLEKEGEAQRKAADLARQLADAQERQRLSADALIDANYQLNKQRKEEFLQKQRELIEQMGGRQFFTLSRSGRNILPRGGVVRAAERAGVSVEEFIAGETGRRSEFLLQRLIDMFANGLEITRDGRLRGSVEIARMGRRMGAGGLV